MSEPKGFKVIRTPEDASKHADEELLNRMNNVKPVPGKRISYHIKPRYTPGSPAMVDFGIAKRAAYQEAQQHHDILSEKRAGYDELIAKAKELGVQGIVYAMDERADCWIVTDLITGAVHVRLFDKRWKTPSAELLFARTMRRKYGVTDVENFDGTRLS